MRYHHKKRISVKGPEYAEALAQKRLRMRERYSLPSIDQFQGILPTHLAGEASASLEATLEETLEDEDPANGRNRNHNIIAEMVDDTMLNANLEYFNDFENDYDINNY